MSATLILKNVTSNYKWLERPWSFTGVKLFRDTALTKRNILLRQFYSWELLEKSFSDVKISMTFWGLEILKNSFTISGVAWRWELSKYRKERVWQAHNPIGKSMTGTQSNRICQTVSVPSLSVLPKPPYASSLSLLHTFTSTNISLYHTPVQHVTMVIWQLSVQGISTVYSTIHIYFI